jgi:predicted ATPase/DNA-binding winged helix-turn-helix (wHTH) protein
MDARQIFCFGPFELDVDNQELRREGQPIPLRPKPFAVLRYFVENPKRLIPGPELLKAVWPDTVVVEGLLRGYLHDVRRALGDDVAHAQFIETVPRRGFRFLAEIGSEPASRLPESAAKHNPSFPKLFGREGDLGVLHASLQKAQAGTRQIVLIAGEAGIGKTGLMNTFLGQARGTDSVLTAVGQCVEQYGTREAYLPIFDALATLMRGRQAKEVVAKFSRYAPTWLVQMPGIVPDDQFASLQQRVQGATQTRMLREFCEALEALAIDYPIIVGIEDLQWSDSSTLDLLSVIARRREPARLLLLGTYRPTDVIVSGHPLRAVTQELQVHGLCVELLPDYLTQSDVSEYISDRFPNNKFPPGLSQLVYRVSSGNPLFVTVVIDDLVRDQSLQKRDDCWVLNKPVQEIAGFKSHTLRRVIDGQLARLSPGEQQVLEAGAVVGREFSADVVAAALEAGIAETEQRCDELAQRGQFVCATENDLSRNSARAGRYTFVHDLYWTAAYDRSSRNRRRRWYQRIADKIRIEAGEHDDVATELAYYFEQAGLAADAAYFCALAGERSLRRFANGEAIAQFRRGIELLKNLSASKDRDVLELRLTVGLAIPLATQGYSTEELSALMARASELNSAVGEGPQTFGLLRALYLLHLGRSDFVAALDFSDRARRLAEKDNEPLMSDEALRMRGISTFALGQLADSQDALQRSLAFLSRHPRNMRILASEDDPETASAEVLALVLWLRGYPDQALQMGRHALAAAQSHGVAFSTATSRTMIAMLMRFLRDVPATWELANAAVAICEEHGFTSWRIFASHERAWAYAMQGHLAAGIKEIQATLTPGSAALGAGQSWVKLAEVYLQAGKINEGVRALEQAFEFTLIHSERYWEPELHRLRGEFFLRRPKRGGKPPTSKGDLEQAEMCFSTAIKCAREIDAKSLELRAAISLHRLLSKRRREGESRPILHQIYNWFTEGFDTADLIEARGLLRGP